MNLGVDQRQVNLANPEQRVTERQDVAAVQVGDGAGGHGAHVTAHQLDADGGARLHVAGRRWSGAAAAARLQRHQPGGAQLVGQLRDGARREPRHRQRYGRAHQPRLAHGGRRAHRGQPQSARQGVGRAERVVRRGRAQVRGQPGDAVLTRREVLARDAARPAALCQHRFDWRDAAKRLFRKAPRVGDGADQLAVDVDGAAAHAGDDAAEFDARVLGAYQNDVLLRQEVAHDGHDADLEGLRLGPLKHRQGLPHHPRADVGQRHDGGWRSRWNDGMQPHALSRESGDRESEGGKRREQTQATATHETLRVGGRVPAVNATPAFSREKPRLAELACVRQGGFGAHMGGA